MDEPLPECGRDFDGAVCGLRGDHFCAPRADHAQAFCEEICVHTKDKWAGRPFVLADWQRDQIVRPLFGQVVWSAEHQRYVRRYRIAWIEVARKAGKSTLLAFIALYLLIGDGTFGSEIYGCAGDRDQARKVWDTAEKMVALSPLLSRRLRTYRQAKRIVDEKTGSYYEVVAADAKGNLGHNPHGVIFDEVLTQPDGALWDAMRTAMGTRVEPLMVAATTAGNQDSSFAKAEHDECVRIAEDPDRAPHRFVYLRNTPADADPWDEANWPHANPGLGDFLSLQALRDEALEAKNEPAKENTFRQYRLNQWVQQSTRWMPMHLYDAASGQVWQSPDAQRKRLAGHTAWCGFDLSAKFDLTAWCLLLPPAKGEESAPVDVLWRFWIPETGLKDLDKHTGGQFSRWAKQGWVTVTDGDVLDYDTVYTDIAADARHFDIRGADCDQWSMFPVIQEIQKRTGLRDEQLVAYANTFDKMTPGMTELMALVRAGRFAHHANPVARFCFDACEVRHAAGNPDLIRPDKPAREATGKRVDAVTAAAMAAAAWSTRGKQKPKSRRVAGF